MFYIQFSETIELQSNIFTNKNHNVMIKKTYEIPESELITVQFEKGFLEVSGGVNYSNYRGGAGGNDGYDDGEGY